MVSFFNLHLRRFSFAAISVLAMVLLPLVATPLGAFLEVRLFLEPVERLRSASGMGPSMHPDLRLILVEDRSLAKLGRQPGISEWIEVARLLAKYGFERVLVVGPEKPGDINRVDLTPSVNIYQGVAEVPDPLNLRAVAVDAVPSRLFVPMASDQAPFNVATHLIGVIPNSLPAVDRLGVLNLPDANTVPVAYRVQGRGLIPYLGLLAAPSLRWDDAAQTFVAPSGPVRYSPDGNMLPNHLEFSETKGKAIGASFLFGNDYRDVVTKITGAVAELLAGGKVAIIIPDAYTGTRFIETGVGNMPSYMAVVAVANSVLTGKYIYQPFEAFWLLAVSALLVGLAIIRVRGKLAIYLAASLAVLAVTTGIALFFASGIVIPVAGMTLISLGATLISASDFALSRFKERLAMQKDLELGSAVQGLLFPSNRDGEFGGWRFHLVFEPYGPMSGDWYQHYLSPPGAKDPICVLAVGDVVGKGPSAALATAMIAAVWAALADRWDAGGFNLRETLESLNHALLRTYNGEQNSTLSLAVLHPDRADLITLGTSGWVQLAADGTASRLPSPRANPLGIDGTLQPVDAVARFVTPTQGTVLAAYTDGVMDGLRSRQRFSRLLAERKTEFVAAPFPTIERTMREVGASSAFPDDFTLLLIERVAATADQRQVS